MRPRVAGQQCDDVCLQRGQTVTARVAVAADAQCLSEAREAHQQLFVGGEPGTSVMAASFVEGLA